MSEVYGSKPGPEEAGNLGNNHQKIPFKQYFDLAWEIIKILIIAAVIVLPIRYFLFQPFIVKGDSMVPNFHSGDYLIVDEISYRFVNPQRGDVVVLKFPADASQRFIKRIVGLPGETVDIKNGKVSITKDGTITPLHEEYLPATLSTDGNTHLTLSDGNYFVMGDNRPFSYDSRRWGVLPEEDIIGRAFIRIYPFTNISYFSAPTY